MGLSAFSQGGQQIFGNNLTPESSNSLGVCDHENADCPDDISQSRLAVGLLAISYSLRGDGLRAGRQPFVALVAYRLKRGDNLTVSTYRLLNML